MVLEVCPIDWEAEDKKGSNDSLQIRSWCLDKQNKPHLIRYETYKPFIFFAFPKEGETGGRKKWDIEDAEDFYKGIKRALGNNSRYLDEFEDDDFCRKKTLFNYQPHRRRMLKLRFTNLDALRHASNLARKGIYMQHTKVCGPPLLQEIDPVLKLLVDMDITHTCWYTVSAKKVTKEVDKISTLEEEYIGDYGSIKKSDYSVPYNPMIASYDIECYSHNHKAFPREWCTKDVVYMISIIFFRPGELEDKRKRYCILMGECDESDNDGKFELIKVKTESALIYKFCELIDQYQTDIITGYNIAQFDNGYLDSRLKIKNKKWPVIGRLKGRGGLINRLQWGSSAYGEKNIKKMFMPGRIMLDYFEETRRTKKWDTYTLENAAAQILKDDPTKRKHDISAEEMFKTYELMVEWMKEDDSPKRQNAMKKMREVVNYCIQDSELVVDMIEKTNWNIANIEMSNVVGVTMQDMFLGGQQRRCLALLYREAYNNDIILDHRVPAKFFFEGGKVQDPVKGLHRLALTVDFASLYPNLMITYNLGHDTLIKEEDWHLYDEEDMETAEIMTTAEPEEGEQLEDKKKKDLPKSKRIFKFIKKHIYQSITAKILVGLINKRGEVRKEQKQYKAETLEWVVLECRQLAYKVSANSLYGFFGVREGGKRPCLEVAATVTYFGRKAITRVIDQILEHYPGSRLIYGDTDSCMMQLPDVTLANAWAKSHELAAFASSLFSSAGSTLKMEAEWPSDILCIKMKHYAKMKVNDKTNDYYRGKDGMREIEYKGMMPTRRDSCKWAKDVFSAIISLIMEGFGYAECVKHLVTELLALYQGKIETDELVISKKLGSGYKSDTATMKVFADEMAKIGKTINPGERHKYIVLANGKTRVGERMMLLESYESGLAESKIDYNYYYENLLMKKIDIVSGASFSEYADELDTFGMVIKGRRTSAVKPAKLAHNLVRYAKNPREKRAKLKEFYTGINDNFSHIGRVS